jgi:hypothetical protein
MGLLSYLHWKGCSQAQLSAQRSKGKAAHAGRPMTTSPKPYQHSCSTCKQHRRKAATRECSLSSQEPIQNMPT